MSGALPEKPPRTAYMALRDAEKMSRLPLPLLEAPHGVIILGMDQETGFPVIQWDEAAVQWVAGILAWAEERAKYVTGQRSEMKKDIDRCADEAQKRIAEVDTRFRAAYAKPLKAWIDLHKKKDRKSIKLLTCEVGYATERAAPARIENSQEEAALVAWVEEHLGYEFVERKPRAKWKEVKEKLKALGIEKAPVGDRAVIYLSPSTGEPLMDPETAEVKPMVVPGVKLTDAGDIVWASASGEVPTGEDEDE